MCAIAGLLVKPGQSAGHIRRMTELMRHRGPDDNGFLFHGPAGTCCLPLSENSDPDSATRRDFAEDGTAWLALGHRRLSILDLSPHAHQPMHAGTRYWIVYNGEIYNYLELRAELEQAGHQFRSHSDTEVILAAYREWGTESFSRFNGMWAFAIFDAYTNELILSRDRFGVKPLYYWQTRELFAFASEIKAFTCLPGWRARINGQAVHDFLLSGLQDHSEETMFAEVRQVGPGCFARLDCSAWLKQARSSAARIEMVTWYNICPRPFGGTLEQAAEHFRELLLSAVQLRLRADVPIGSCLSGGLDSSSIVCAAHQLLNGSQQREAHKTFSACSELERFDERKFIEQVRQKTGVQSHCVFPSPKQLFAELDRIVWHQDEPFGGTSIFAQWCVFKLAAASQVTVMLDGQGADELLYGYTDFRRAFLCGLLHSGHALEAWREALAARGTPSRAVAPLLRALVDSAVPGSIQTAFRGMRHWRPPGWLNANKLGACFPGRLAARYGHRRSARDMSLELLNGAHLQMLLHWEDRNSMAHSLESRVPFLDYRLVEFVTGLPDDYKIRDGLTKAVLRKGMANLVPAAILERRDKMGFVTPEELWARETGEAGFRPRLQQAVESCQGIVNPEAATILEQNLTGDKPYDSAIWRIICLGAWMQIFSVIV